MDTEARRHVGRMLYAYSVGPTDGIHNNVGRGDETLSFPKDSVFANLSTEDPSRYREIYSTVAFILGQNPAEHDILYKKNYRRTREAAFVWIPQEMGIQLTDPEECYYALNYIFAVSSAAMIRQTLEDPQVPQDHREIAANALLSAQQQLQTIENELLLGENTIKKFSEEDLLRIRTKAEAGYRQKRLLTTKGVENARAYPVLDTALLLRPNFSDPELDQLVEATGQLLGDLVIIARTHNGGGRLEDTAIVIPPALKKELKLINIQFQNPLEACYAGLYMAFVGTIRFLEAHPAIPRREKPAGVTLYKDRFGVHEAELESAQPFPLTRLRMMEIRSILENAWREQLDKDQLDKEMPSDESIDSVDEELGIIVEMMRLDAQNISFDPKTNSAENSFILQVIKQKLDFSTQGANNILYKSIGQLFDIHNVPEIIHLYRQKTNNALLPESLDEFISAIGNLPDQDSAFIDLFDKGNFSTPQELHMARVVLYRSMQVIDILERTGFIDRLGNELLLGDTIKRGVRDVIMNISLVAALRAYNPEVSEEIAAWTQYSLLFTPL